MNTLELLLLGNLLRRGTRKRREQEQPYWDQPDTAPSGGTIYCSSNVGTAGWTKIETRSTIPAFHSPRVATDTPRCPYCNQPVDRCGCGAY